ncbi:MAG TPA: hypothetical protein DGN60_06390 [Chloroflexi bacterium]|nr:hypothetical protein [Chloroflexota bacterium]|tara:strand:- start:2617 stop:3108 length:492 start_codon:yes stop_codon:yes gene_type:complete
MAVRQKMTADGHLDALPEKSFKQAQWRRHRQITAPILIIVFALGMFGAIYLAETSRAAVTGRHVQQLRRQVENIGYENDLIHANNAYLESASLLMERAGQLGYVPLQLEQIEYLMVPNFDYEQDNSYISSSEGSNSADSTSYYDESLTEWAVRHIVQWGFIEE